MTLDFGAQLRRRREQAGMTQEDLAERSGVSVTTIRKIENGRRANPRISTVRALADALELEAADRAGFVAAAGHVTRPHDETHQTGPGDREDPPFADPFTQAAAHLAREVGFQWREEEEHQRIQDPVPLPVRWRSMPAEQVDTWANISRTRNDDGVEPIGSTGQLDEIAEVYRRIPSRRLVVLGRAGAGKTILTIRFVLDMLASRAPNDPVPVVFSLESWDPNTTSLRDWVITQLLRDHPDLNVPGPGGSTLAASLVKADLILPVLDGFDEIAPDLRPVALAELNRALNLPLLITSRPDEYQDALGGVRVLKHAAGVALTDLSPADLADYLPRTTRRSVDGVALWTPVLNALRDPVDSGGKNIAAALATPLMVSLARTVYSDTQDRHPSDLLDTTVFPDAAAIENHLLDDFVPIVYRPIPGRPGFAPDRALRWLGHLAVHLDQLGTQDLAWWQLGATIPVHKRMLIMALATYPVFGLVDLAVELFMFGEVSAYVVAFAAVFGLVAGAGIGLAHGLSAGFKRRTIEPSRMRLRFRGGRDLWWWSVARRFRTGLVAGAAVGLGYGLLRGVLNVFIRDLDLGQDLMLPLVDAVLFGLVFGLSAGLVLALMVLCEVPLETESVISPEALLRASRMTVIAQVLVFGTVLALILPFTIWFVIELLQPLTPVIGIGFVWDPLAGLTIGLIGGIGGGIGYALSLTAWGQWLVFARVWLPLTGRLPWAVSEFFEDAYDRGVLRRAGAVYRFRHLSLQEHLAAGHRPGRRN